MLMFLITFLEAVQRNRFSSHTIESEFKQIASDNQIGWDTSMLETGEEEGRPEQTDRMSKHRPLPNSIKHALN